MKRVLKRVIMMFGCAALAVALAACGDSGNTSEEVSSDTASGDSAASGDAVSITDASGDVIELTQVDNYMVSGTYVCAGDGSVWVFDGNHSMLAVAYNDESNGGKLGCYMCVVGFYATDEDENGEAHLVLVIQNESTGDVTFWYTTNLVSSDEDVLGIRLERPADPDTVLTLYSQSYYNELLEEMEASGDANQP